METGIDDSLIINDEDVVNLCSPIPRSTEWLGKTMTASRRTSQSDKKHLKMVQQQLKVVQEPLKIPKSSKSRNCDQKSRCKQAVMNSLCQGRRSSSNSHFQDATLDEKCEFPSDQDAVFRAFLKDYDNFELPKSTTISETGRCKEDRRQLQGQTCACCLPYFEALNLSPKSHQSRIDQVSRHRAVQPRELTPENYWDVDFPDTNECIRRGYIQKEPYVRHQPKNWREKLGVQNTSKQYLGVKFKL